jgi:uncharacterized membrane protein YeaQ/YmgE (transglycosylase-associated protein family)
MDILIYLLVGAFVGWAAYLVRGTSNRQGLALNIVVGILGALGAGWFISPLLGIRTINEVNFGVSGLLVSLGGAIVPLGAINLLRREA